MKFVVILIVIIIYIVFGMILGQIVNFLGSRLKSAENFIKALDYIKKQLLKIREH